MRFPAASAKILEPGTTGCRDTEPPAEPIQRPAFEERESVNSHRNRNISAGRLRVTYFTVVALDTDQNGGAQCCRNHLLRISADPRVDCFALVASPRSAQSGVADYLKSMDLKGRVVTLNDLPDSAKGGSVKSPRGWLKSRWPFFHELDALKQHHLDRALAAHLAEERPDCVVVDYLPSAFYVPSVYKSGVPVVTITLNREAEFYRNLIRYKAQFYGRPANPIAALRLGACERWIHWRSRAVVAVGQYDLPRAMFGRPLTSWMPPYMDPRTPAWSYSGSRSVFFVGNYHHYPNMEAIDWIANRFSPELAAIDPSMSIKIVGAAPGNIPNSWHRSNIHYLGSADRRTVERLFQTEAGLIAPIANNFGAKFKIVEAIGYATPILATDGAMSGVSCLPSLPRIRLDQPAEAARLAGALIQDASAQEAQSKAVRTAADNFIRSQEGAWGRLLEQVVLPA